MRRLILAGMVCMVMSIGEAQAFDVVGPIGSAFGKVGSVLTLVTKTATLKTGVTTARAGVKVGIAVLDAVEAGIKVVKAPLVDLDKTLETIEQGLDKGKELSTS